MRRFAMGPTVHPILVLTVLLPLMTRARPVVAQSDAKTAAREHFRRGVAAFEDKRFAEAADEFQTAYKLSPAFQVLYNIGQVDVALGHSVEAVDAFETYLKQGATAVPGGRAREVKAEIDKQMARIGTLKIDASPSGADIRLDGRLVGHAPLAQPLRATAGSHTVEANLTGYVGQVRDVDVAGKTQTTVPFHLEPIAEKPQVPVAPPADTAPVPAAVPAMPEPKESQPLPLVAAPAPAPQGVESRSAEPRPEPATESSYWGWQRIGGLVVAAGGLAVATWGGIEAYRGANQANDARNLLSMATPSTPDNVWNRELSDYNAGKSENQKGWITAGIGAAVTVGGVLLLVTAPSHERSTSVAMTPWTTMGAGGAAISGCW